MCDRENDMTFLLQIFCNRKVMFYYCEELYSDDMISVIKKFCEYVYMRRKKLEQLIPKFGIIKRAISKEICSIS